MKSKAKQKEYAKLVEKLRFLMEEEFLYHNPTLDVSLLSHMLGVSKGKLSKLINGHLGKSVTTYVNDYRLQEVLHVLKTKDSKTLTITGVAMEAGFCSKSTFYRHFKYRMNCSPSAFFKNKERKRVYFSNK